MKKRICGLIILIGFILVVGIVGGVDNGEPLSNAWWCFPIMFAMWGAGKIGGFYKY